MQATTRSEWDEVRAASLHLSAGVWAGLLSGLVIGGFGGRMAMFVLRVTSDPSLHGRLTDDDFKIGSFTGSTIFLVLLCTAAGTIGGTIYLLVRSWLPERRRALYWGFFWATAGGAMVIEPGGIDFTLVEPHALSIALFIVLPGLYGIAVGSLAERFLDRQRAHATVRPVLAFLPLIGLGAIGPFAIFALAIGLIGWFAARHFPIVALWNSAPIVGAGRVLLSGITVFALVTLTRDITEIL